MNLKKLHEKARWDKLPPDQFRSDTINYIIEQKETIDNLSDMVVQLTEDIQLLKRHLNNAHRQNIRTNRNIKSNPRTEDDNNAEQKRDNGSVSKSNQSHI